MSLWLTHPLFLPSLIVGVTIVLWATSLLPEFITALLFFAAAMMAKIAPPEVIFGGFAIALIYFAFENVWQMNICQQSCSCLNPSSKFG